MVKPPKAAQRYKNGGDRCRTKCDEYGEVLPDGLQSAFFKNPSSCPRERVTPETLRSQKKNDKGRYCSQPVDRKLSIWNFRILVRMKEIKFSICYLTPLLVHKRELISIPSKIHFISEPVHRLKVVL